MHRPPLSAKQSADHAQTEFMALTLDAGRNEGCPVCGSTGMPEGEIGDQVTRELRDFFFLAHAAHHAAPAAAARRSSPFRPRSLGTGQDLPPSYSHSTHYGSSGSGHS